MTKYFDVLRVFQGGLAVRLPFRKATRTSSSRDGARGLQSIPGLQGVLSPGKSLRKCPAWSQPLQVFEFLLKGFDALGMAEHQHYELVQ